MLRVPLLATRRPLVTNYTNNYVNHRSRQWMRHISTNQFDPIIREFTSELAKIQPVFAISPSSIRILAEPQKFYNTLMEMIKRAEKRIFISSLYIGSSESELITSLHQALRDKPSLHLYLNLDLNRSTRPGPSSTAKILLPILRDFGSRVHVSMFRSPSLRGILAKLVPPRFNEGWGTWHVKVYGVDDEVMISGANLNESYFTNRQDRYIHFSDQKHLAQYCFDFLQVISKFSYRLAPSASNNNPLSLSFSTSPHSQHRDGYSLIWPDPELHPHYIHEKAHKELTNFQRSYTNPASSPPSNEANNYNTDKALLFPIIQAGQFNVREEERTFHLLFQHLQTITKSFRSSRPLLDLTSGYFSLYEPYQSLILRSQTVDCRIVAASPKANGFYGSSGISGLIPEAYANFEKKFVKAIAKAGRSWQGTSGVQLCQWEKNGWTYHAKGIWLSPNSSSPPVLTLFGSTNLNSRSANLDTELSFVMAIPSTKSAELPKGPDPACRTDGASPVVSLQTDLAQEVKVIRSNVSDWVGERHKVRFVTKVIAWFVKGML